MTSIDRHGKGTVAFSYLILGSNRFLTGSVLLKARPEDLQNQLHHSPPPPPLPHLLSQVHSKAILASPSAALCNHPYPFCICQLALVECAERSHLFPRRSYAGRKFLVFVFSEQAEKDRQCWAWAARCTSLPT